ALCEDVVNQFGVSRVHLEGVMHLRYDFDWLRPRVLVQITPLASELLALCFCVACTARAADVGLDVGRLRRLVNGAIAVELAQGSSASSASIAEDLLGDRELQAFAVQHERSALELMRAVRRRVGPETHLASTTWTPFATLLGDQEDALLEELVG